MKRFPVPVLLLLPLLSAAQDEVRIPSAIQHVTVFLNRAQIDAQARTTLAPGTTRLIIDNVPALTDPQSLQVSGRGDAVIQGVQFRTNFLTNVPKPAALTRLEDSLRSARETFQLLELQKDVLQEEKKLLLSNQKVGGEKGATVDEVEEMAELYQKRLTEIGQKLIRIERPLEEARRRLARLEGQVNEQNARRNQPIGEIEVTLTARSRTPIELALSYVVSKAGWTPVYDVRVRDTKSPASLAYKAQVYQNTGIDWQNVRLTLSTSNPALSGAQPDLNPQYVGFYEPKPVSIEKQEAVRVGYGAPSMSKRANVAVSADTQEGAAPAPELANTAEFVQATDQPLSVRFDIAIPYTVLTNSRPQLVDVQVADLPATFRYSATPKLDNDAFLVANVAGWEKLNLLNGTARVYFEGTYVGETQLNLQRPEGGAPADTLTLSLGRDKKIIVKREKIEDFSSRRGIGSSVRDAYSYRLTVRNTKAEPVQLTLYDQIPLSTDSRIEVELTDGAGAMHNAETGRLTWNLNLKPNETRELTFRYTVKYPKGKQLAGSF